MKHYAISMIAVLTAAVLVLPLLSGCSGGTDGRQSVSGTVTLGGKPLADGKIVFEPVAAASEGITTAGGTITKGQYFIPANQGIRSGQYRVQIIAREVVPGKTETKISPSGQKYEAPMERNLIPDEFGDKSTQQVEVTTGKNQFNFDMNERP